VTAFLRKARYQRALEYVGNGVLDSVGEPNEMKKILLATVAFVALGATAPALAADLGARPAYTKAPAIAAPIYNWTGFYIGAHVGGAFGNDSTFNGLVVGNNNNDARFLGGLQVGADYQFAPNWVLGVEGQYSWLGNSNRGAVFPNGYAFAYDQRGLGSITGRLGYTWGPAMIYVKGGYAYSDNRETLLLGGVPQAFAFDKNHRDGWTVGAGLEYMFAQNWSAKAEYQYYDFGNATFVNPAVLAPFGSFRNDEHTVKVGINYRFNFGGPVVAKY
jgi:outer membrane immunogenic protein